MYVRRRRVDRAARRLLLHLLMLVRVLAACAALAGCVDDPQPQPMLDAQQQFMQSAWPALVAGTHVTLDLPGGGRIGFTPNPVDGGLYLTDLAIIAGTRGLHVTHPLFVSEPAKLPIVIDGLDRFADIDATLGPDEVLAL